MFLDWVSSLTLLEQGKETNILKDFPLPVRKIVVSQVVNLFLDPNTPPAILSTPTHVQWVMECVGQGFLLPVEDLQVIVACIDLYKRWLLEPNKPRPPPVTENEQHFTRIIMQHFSLIFTPRPGISKESTDAHTILCQRVLTIILEFGRTCKPSVETWEVVLKLVLGVCDCILGGERGADESQTKNIAPFLLKVLFELWLHARTTDPELWGSLVKLTSKWLHLMPMAVQWNATTLGLSNRLTTLLYTHADPTATQFPHVSIKTSEVDAVNIDLSPEHVYYAWHRMFHVMGNINNLASPVIFVAAMTGLNTLVRQFLKVGRSLEQRDKPDVPRPDGNTILHIFGSWLFEAVKQNRTTFDEGTAIAVETLNHIFNACQHSGLAPVYLASFYSCMAEALNSEGRVLMSAVQFGQWLMFSELAGARVLVPLYHPSVTPPDVIRRCCIKILGGLICLPNRFGDLTIPTISSKPVKQVVTEKTLAEIVSYKDTLPHLSYLVLSGLSTEKSPQNTELLLWYTPIFLRELAAAVQNGGSPVSPSEFAVGVVEVIVSSVCGSVWNNEVSQAACRVLSSISRMYSHFPNGAEMGYTLTKSLCEFALSHIGISQQDEDLAAAIIMCVTDWALVDQWLVTKRAALEVFLAVCMLGLGARDHPPDNEPVVPPSSSRASMSPSQFKKPKSAPGEKLKQAAQHGLLNVLHHIGNFPAATGPSRISSLISEEDVVQKIKDADPSLTDPEDFVRYFIVDESFMLSIIDIPNGTSDPSCVVVIRDRTGKYVWNAHKPYLPFVPKKETDSEDRESSSSDLQANESTDDLTKAISSPVRSPESTTNSPALSRPRALVSEGSHGDLKLLVAVEADLSRKNRAETFQELTNYINTHTDDTFLQLTERVLETEHLILGQVKDKSMAVSIATQPPARQNPYLGTCKLQLGRQLLSSLGLFSSCHSKVVPLHPGPALSACIKAMDAIAERAQHKVGVIYAAKGQNADEVFANVRGSAEYKDFLASLGWPVHVPTHKGFLGGLDPKGQHGLEAPYYATYSLETIFAVASLMPNNFSSADPTKPNTSHKKAILKSTPVVIVWSEDHRFDTTTLTDSVPLQIVIIPQNSGMYRVKILKTTSIAKTQVGPISEDVVVSRQVLGDMIRETAIIASQLINPIVHPFTNRRNYIEQMSRSFKSPNMGIDAFYGKIFSVMPKTTFQPIIKDALGLRRPPVGVLKGITPPPPPPSIQPTAGTPEKFALSGSSDFVAHSSVMTSPIIATTPPPSIIDSSLLRSQSDSNVSLAAHPIHTLTSSGDAVKTEQQKEPHPSGITRNPSFGNKDPIPPATQPIPIPSSSNNAQPSNTGTPTKTSSLTDVTPPSPELPSFTTRAAESGSKPPSPSPPTQSTPPLATTTTPNSNNTFLRAKVSGRSSSPLVGSSDGTASLHHHQHHHKPQEPSPASQPPPTQATTQQQQQPPQQQRSGLFSIGGRSQNTK